MTPALFLRENSFISLIPTQRDRETEKERQRERSHQDVKRNVESVKAINKCFDGLQGAQIELQNIHARRFVVFKNMLFCRICGFHVPGSDDDMSSPKSQHSCCLQPNSTCPSCIFFPQQSSQTFTVFNLKIKQNFAQLGRTLKARAKLMKNKPHLQKACL
jgi:hypothetical protein